MMNQEGLQDLFPVANLLIDDGSESKQVLQLLKKNKIPNQAILVGIGSRAPSLIFIPQRKRGFSNGSHYGLEEIAPQLKMLGEFFNDYKQ